MDPLPLHTYALSLSFYESVVLDGLTRGGAEASVILSDIDGVRGALSEIGARRAGRDYEVEPVRCASGCFHPKVGVLCGEGDGWLLVGSGNLTFNGWGGNLEVLEALHPDFAPRAFEDAAGFFEGLAGSPRLAHGAGAHCQETATDLRRLVAGRDGPDTLRFIHNLDRSLSDQMVEMAEIIGGCTRLRLQTYFLVLSSCSRRRAAFGLEKIRVSNPGPGIGPGRHGTGAHSSRYSRIRPPLDMTVRSPAVWRWLDD